MPVVLAVAARGVGWVGLETLSFVAISLDKSWRYRYVIPMHTTPAQNAAHRADLAWIKTKGSSFRVFGELYISEYLNPWNGMAIRKSCRMTGQDWFIFNADGGIVGRAHSLTQAKYDATAGQ